jgi:hypothetical protein
MSAGMAVRTLVSSALNIPQLRELPILPADRCIRRSGRAIVSEALPGDLLRRSTVLDDNAELAVGQPGTGGERRGDKETR